MHDQGLLLVEGQPSDSTLDHTHLLALTSRSGYVKCCSKLVYFKYHATIAEITPDSDSSRSDEDDEQTEEPLDKVVVMVWPLLLPFSSLFSFSPLPPSFHSSPTPSDSVHLSSASFHPNSKPYSHNHATSIVGLAPD